MLTKASQQVEAVRRSGRVLKVEPTEANTHKLFTTRRYPIYYLAITKCGSTYLKNLFYVLDHDVPHERAEFIHNHGKDLIRANETPPWMIKKSNLKFTVVRAPVSRFVSLYFDKIYGEGPQNFPDIREELVRSSGLDLGRNLSVEAHRDNCFRFVDWLHRNFQGETRIGMNPHWRPQTARIAAVKHFDLTCLTLDGLDWQLPIFLGDAIPKLDEKIKIAANRNKSHYPIDRHALVDRALEARINRLYADDYVLYQHAARGWTRRKPLAAPVVETGDASLNVLTTHRFNLNAQVIQKAGCTYVRNMFYHLDHGRAHTDPENIVNDECLVYSNKTRKEIRRGVSMIVFRDPYMRFFSLYFDKVWGEGQQAFPWIAKQLAKNRRFRKSRELSQAEHHDNCCRFLGYLQTRFKERPIAELNPHWRPQIAKLERAKAFGLQPVLLEDFQNQFLHICQGRVRGVEEAFNADIYRNATEKPIEPADLLSPWIKERLQGLYGDDIALYERIKAGWAESGEPPEL